MSQQTCSSDTSGPQAEPADPHEDRDKERERHKRRRSSKGRPKQKRPDPLESIGFDLDEKDHASMWGRGTLDRLWGSE